MRTKQLLLLGIMAAGSLAVAAPFIVQDKYVPYQKDANGLDSDTLASGCGMEGDATDQAHKDLDRLKNRHSAPTDFDSTANIDSMMQATSGSNTFDQHKGAKVEGFLVKVTLEKQESCNCHSSNSADYDFHCFVAKTADAPRNERIVVEVTPRERFWTLGRMQALVGHKVRVTGWLLDDFMHKDASEADSPGKSGNWRASTWEIHPVTNIEVPGDESTTTTDTSRTTTSTRNTTSEAELPPTDQPAHRHHRRHGRGRRHHRPHHRHHRRHHRSS